MSETLLIIAVMLLAVVVILQVVQLFRKVQIDLSPVAQAFQSVEKANERTERAVREEIAKNREELTNAARQSREEIANTLKGVADSLNKQLATMREAVAGQLKSIQDDNAKQLEEMRKTVDEKLQGTLEKRLGESFKLVSERLEAVYKGLGEMQTLATGVGDLKRVLTSVKARGTWGEVQLERMLEEILTPEQYGKNVSTGETREAVEFAIKLPGRGENKEEIVWLPIDAKFPVEDYQRLMEAQEAGDGEAAEAASKQLEVRIKGCAVDICCKYLNPPKTTDFGILFLPTEGLFAEVVRRPGLAETIQRTQHVVIAGPTTLWSILNSLQMGFRTLAIQQRSSEVWNLLAAVKTEFGRYGDVMAKVQKKLQEASNTVDTVAVRSRAIERKLKGVEELPTGDALKVLSFEDGVNGEVEGDDEVGE
jgi:DNA recombination protein RmuC